MKQPSRNVKSTVEAAGPTTASPGAASRIALAAASASAAYCSDVGLRLPEVADVRLVPDFPKDAAALEVRGRRRRPAGVGPAARLGRHGLVGFVKLVAVIEDEDGVHLVRVEGGEQPFVSREIVPAALSFRAGPGEVHPHPAEAARGQHVHFARLSGR